MKYHATRKEILPSLVVTLLCVLLSLYAVLHLHIDNPLRLWSEHTFQTLAAGNHGSVRIGSIDRTFLHDVTSGSVRIEAPGVDLSADQVVFREGVLSLVAKLASRSGAVDVEFRHPQGTISPRKGTGAPLELPAMVRALAWRVALTDADVTVTTDGVVAQTEGLDVDLFMKRGGVVGSLKVDAPAVDLASASGSARLQGGSFYLEDSGIVYGRLASARAEQGQTRLRFGDLRWQSRIREGSYPLQLSLVDFDFRQGDVHLTSPLASGSLSFDSERFPDIAHMSLPSFREGTVSVSSLSVDKGAISTTLPTSTLAVTRNGVRYGIGFAVGENDTVRIVGPDGSLLLEGLHANGQLDLSEALFDVSVTSSRLGWRGDAFEASLAGASGSGRFTADGFRTGTVSGHGSFSLQGNSVEGDLAADARMDDGMLSVAVTADNVATNLLDIPFSGEGSFHWDTVGASSSMRLSLTSPGLLHVEALLEHLETGRPAATVTANVSDLPFAAMDGAWHAYLPLITPYYDEKTSLRGNLYLYSDEDRNGAMQYDLTMADMKFGQFRFRAGSTGQFSLDGNLVTVSSITLGVQDYRLEFQGSIPVGTWFPSGRYELTNVVTGDSLFSINTENTGERRYAFQANSVRFPQFSMHGTILGGDDVFSGTSDLRIKEMTYPISFSYTISTQDLQARSGDAIVMQAEIRNPFLLSFAMDDFRFPRTPHLDDARVSGTVTFSYRTRDDWSFSASDMDLSGINLAGSTYRFRGGGTVDPEGLRFPQVLVDDGTTTFTGSVKYAGSPLQENIRSGLQSPFSFSFLLKDDEGQYAEFYLGKEASHLETMVDAKRVDLRRFLGDKHPLSADFSLVGDIALDGKPDLSGTVRFSQGTESISGDLSLSGDELLVDHIRADIGTGHVRNGRVRADLGQGMLEAGASLSSDFHISKLDDAGSGADVSLSLQFPSRDVNLLSLIPEGTLWRTVLDFLSGSESTTSFELPTRESFFRQLSEESYQATVQVDHLSVFGSPLKNLDSFSLTASYEPGMLRLGGDLLSGTVDFERLQGDLTLDPRGGVGFHMSGSVDPRQLALRMEDLSLDLSLANMMFAEPLAEIREGLLHGTLFVDGPLSHPSLYGQLACDTLRVWNFYVPSYELTAKNAYFWVEDSHLQSVPTKVFALSTDGHPTVEAQAMFELTLDGFSLGGFRVEAWIEDEPIRFYCPVPEGNVEVSGTLKGNFSLNKMAGQRPLAGGTVEMSDMLVAVGTPRYCPSWYRSANMNLNFHITSGNNNRVIYPNVDNPILSFVIREGQQLDVAFDNPTHTFSADGQLAIRSGDIFYFQKDFYVTEGSVVLRNNATGGVQPLINLRARLREFDTQGEPVDIYLVLNDATIGNFTPVFESTPPKTMEEIMSMLGQSILPGQEEGGSDLYRAASMATMATDVAERLGLIGTGAMTNLSETIRENLGLDVFTFRSPILQNFLLDALPFTSNMSISPLARYLNNTSVFIGKYLGDAIFLQAMLHLNAVDPGSSIPNNSPFMTNDLALNFELSLEWENPLCTFKVFTAPTELSLIQILDTIGLTVTKRVVLF